MELNKDGLEPGQPVDFETLQRVERARRTKTEPTKTKPRRKSRAETTGDE